MAEYLCDEQTYDVELSEIPSSLINRGQAVKNVDKLLYVMDSLLLQKILENEEKELLPYQEYFSWRDLPDSISEALERVTVLNFLNDQRPQLFCELDDMEVELSDLVELFDDSAICVAVKRLENLLHLLSQ